MNNTDNKDQDISNHQPRQAISAYLYFASDRRPQLKYENPDFYFGELTMQIATEWKHMTEEQKQPYIKLAKADKERYELEKQQSNL